MINYSKKYINYINGRYATEGLRITAGIALPSFLLAYFGMLPVGIVISVGALCVSVADTPGPVRHRTNGMLASICLITTTTILTSLASVNNVLLGTMIFLSGFFFSMFTVYGNRSASVGIAALIIMVLGLQSPLQGKELWLHALYVFTGGIWYMLYSLVLYRIRPYKFIEQVLADYIAAVGNFLQLRGQLYGSDAAIDKIEQELLEQQVNIETQQATLSELIFKTRAIVKESTRTGRMVLKTYLEVADLYEYIMTSYQRIAVMQAEFGDTGILTEIEKIIFLLSQDMEAISFSIKSGQTSSPSEKIDEDVQALREKFEHLRQVVMNDKNVELFVSLGRIVQNISVLAAKIRKLHFYRNRISDKEKHKADVKRFRRFADSEDIRPSLFATNLNFRSNIFRHSLRMAAALLVGFILSTQLQISHGYWVLLTIVVILKPAYSLSKIRNKDRLIGTFAGLVIGVAILFVVKNENALLVIMILLMATSNTFIRTNYFMAVMLMTPYLIIFFHFLYPGILRSLMIDRMIDTAIGSSIAFLASLFLVPAWEKTSIRESMIAMIQAADKYFIAIAQNFTSGGEARLLPIRFARRDALLSLSNLSNAFTRMLSEPKRFRQGQQQVHRFVVLQHTLLSHLSSLSYLLQEEKNPYRHAGLTPVIENIREYFSKTIGLLSGEEDVQEMNYDEVVQILNQDVSALVQKRREEVMAGELETATKTRLVETKSVTDQFNFVISDAASIYRISREYLSAD